MTSFESSLGARLPPHPQSEAGTVVSIPIAWNMMPQLLPCEPLTFTSPV